MALPPPPPPPTLEVTEGDGESEEAIERVRLATPPEGDDFEDGVSDGIAKRARIVANCVQKERMKQTELVS